MRSQSERRRKFSEFAAGENVAVGRRFPQPEAQIISHLGIPITTLTKKLQAKLVLSKPVDNCDNFYPTIQRKEHRRTKPAPYVPYVAPTPPASANPPSFPYYVHSKAQALISNQTEATSPESGFIPPTSWGLSIVHKCVVGVVTAVLVGGAICEKIVHGVSAVGGLIYANRETIQEKCTTYATVAVQSSYNAAKRRLVSIQRTQASLSGHRSPAHSPRLQARDKRNRRFAWLYRNRPQQPQKDDQGSPMHGVVYSTSQAAQLSGSLSAQQNTNLSAPDHPPMMSGAALPYLPSPSQDHPPVMSGAIPYSPSSSHDVTLSDSEQDPSSLSQDEAYNDSGHDLSSSMSNQDQDDPIIKCAQSATAGISLHHALTQTNLSLSQVGEVPRAPCYGDSTISEYDEDEILPEALQALEAQAMADGVAEFFSFEESMANHPTCMELEKLYLQGQEQRLIQKQEAQEKLRIEEEEQRRIEEQEAQEELCFQAQELASNSTASSLRNSTPNNPRLSKSPSVEPSSSHSVPSVYSVNHRPTEESTVPPRARNVTFFASPKTRQPVTLAKRYVPISFHADSSSLQESTLSTIYNSAIEQASPNQPDEEVLEARASYGTDLDDYEAEHEYQPMPREITQTSPNVLTDSFNSLRVSGRRESQRILEKARKEEQLRAEKARKEREEAEEAARKEKEAEEERIKQGIRRIPKEKVIQPLNAKWAQKVQQAMETSDMGRVLAKSPTGTDLTRKDLGTLKVVQGRDPPHGWLNDEIVAACLQQVVDYGLKSADHKRGEPPRYYAFNTFFYTNLRDKGVASIRRWANKAKIGGTNLWDVQRVFIPVHSGAHWTLLVVSPMAKTIEYFDSLGGSARNPISLAKAWLRSELLADYKEDDWQIPTGSHGAGPRQTNGSDCGVFTCTTARMVVLGVEPMAYGGSDMELQRTRMVAELLNGGLVGDFEPRVVF